MKKQKIFYWLLIVDQQRNRSGKFQKRDIYINGGYDSKTTAIDRAISFGKKKDVRSIEIFPLPTVDATTASHCIRDFKTIPDEIKIRLGE